MRAVVFANGILGTTPDLEPDDLLIAADGGAHHMQKLGLNPDWVIGDFDSLDSEDIVALEDSGAKLVRFPTRKDYTDLELALRHAQELGADEILVVAALGQRWDQTLANLLLPAAEGLSTTRISLVDGPQEILLLHSGEETELRGKPGDTVSLIPLGGPAYGVLTHNLEYPLDNETLLFGGTRGISNVMLAERASVTFKEGILLCVMIHEKLPVKQKRANYQSAR